MPRRAGVRLALAILLVSGAASRGVGAGLGRPAPVLRTPGQASLQFDLDRIFGDPILARALVGVRVEALADDRVLYARDDHKLVMPASNMKVLTLAVAAARLGWDFSFETSLEAAGTIADGVLHGDLIVVGGGDPSIAAVGGQPPALFGDWARRLVDAGIRRVDGRLIGDDNAFDDAGIGPGWAWDYLEAGYAAPSGALSYNENAVSVRLTPGARPGDAVQIDIAPPGHGLQIVNLAMTGAAGSPADLSLTRTVGQTRLTIRGIVPAGGEPLVRSASVDNPTRFFVDGLRRELIGRGIAVTGDAWDIDDLSEAPAAGPKRAIARHRSPSLVTLAGYFMKVSQNFYAETLVKAIGRAAGGGGTMEAGRRVMRETLAAWGVPADAAVIVDGSGLSRYNYVTAGTMVAVLKRLWNDENMRGPFTASLPVAGHDGTLETRMRGSWLDAHVQAKTGTISNVRALSGYLETRTGRRLVFSIIVNHHTAPTSHIDAIVERALDRLADE